MLEQENLGEWPYLQQYVNGIRAYYNAERSMYSVEHPNCVFDEPKYAKVRSDAFVRHERLKQPLVYNMVSEYFLPLGSLSSTDKKKLLRRFSNGFTEIYAYWLTIKVFPDASGSLFVTHYGHYMDCEDLEDFFSPTGVAKDKQIRLLEPIVRLWSWTFKKFKALKASPTEMSALIALWLFLTFEWVQIETAHRVPLYRQAVLDELVQYLSSKEDSRNAGIRLGQLLLFLSELTELMAHYNDYAVMGRVFLAGEFTCVWDVESHSAEETGVGA
ncbi:hypothetical protein AAVH_27761 [Aphelenchoides avenae]|nr:hypothetical protein AAVH_27761 [Aphelenchus avenae]